MQRRQFVQRAAALPLAGSALFATGVRDGNEVYELRRYDVLFGRPRQALDGFLRDALIPALNRFGVPHVGVFTESSRDMPVRLHVLIPHRGIGGYYEVAEGLAGDTEYRSASHDFEARSSSENVYGRYHTSLLRAFDGMPSMRAPDTSGPRIFELRTYQGHNDDAVARKVAMFNDGEIELFNRIGFRAAFFGRMIAGPDMPALTYMLLFRDMEEVDAQWAAFGSHPDWKAMSARPEYADTVNNIVRVFLEPTAYSQI